MNYLKFTQYAYLITKLVFAYDAFTKWQTEDPNYIISAIFAVIGVFMFFFRQRFAKKFEDRNKKP